MILVVDTNILFSFFWRNSLVRQILTFPDAKFISPEIAFRELKKYSSLIINKAGLSKKEFISEFSKLKSIIKIPFKKDYKDFIEKAEKISPDRDDSDFLALCLKLNLPLWSNDKKLKEQDKVVILNTKDVLEMFLA